MQKGFQFTTRGPETSMQNIPNQHQSDTIPERFRNIENTMRSIGEEEQSTKQIKLCPRSTPSKATWISLHVISLQVFLFILVLTLIVGCRILILLVL
jgi:hypothetical protein